MGKTPQMHSTNTHTNASKSIRFFVFFFKTKAFFLHYILASPCIVCVMPHPRLPLHPTWLLHPHLPCILFSVWKLGFQLKTRNFSQNPNCNHISSSQPTNSGFCRNPTYLIVSELIPPNLLRILHGIAYWFIRNTILIVN